MKIGISFSMIMLITFYFLVSCKARKVNYISYYQSVNEIDSIYRIKQDPLRAVKKYRKLFKIYSPRNQERIEEFETFIRLSDVYRRNFGGRKSIKQLVYLVAPYWRHKKNDPSFMGLCERHGVDRLEADRIVANWEKSLNKKLIDSFSIAFERDQLNNRSEGHYENSDIVNANLLEWTFENYGFPSIYKIGLYGNGDVFMPMHTFLSHLSITNQYSHLQGKLLTYVRSGDCSPKDYATFIDRNYNEKTGNTKYATYQNYNSYIDSGHPHHSTTLDDSVGKHLDFYYSINDFNDELFH